MIGHQKNAPVFSMSHPLQHGPNDFFVEVLDGLNLLLDIAHVARLICSFDMDEDKIVLLQRIYPILALASIVSVQESGDARYKNALEAGVNSQPVYDVHCRNHSAADTESFGQRRQRRRSPLPPKPNRRCLSFPF